MASIADGTNGAVSVQALSAYFRDLDSIQEELEKALGDWETPVVLVFGAESAGKSTILERLKYLAHDHFQLPINNRLCQSCRRFYYSIF